MRRRFNLGEVFTGYAPGRDFPLGAYAAVAGAYQAGLVTLLRRGGRGRRLPERMPLGDAVLLGLATHKLSRIVALDWVTSPFRAPFTRYHGAASGGEVTEKARGRGWRKAVGDLITCNFCMGPWVALALTTGLILRPRETRLVMGIFAAVAASDFLHRAYGLLEKETGLLQQRAGFTRQQAEQARLRFEELASHGAQDRTEGQTPERRERV